MQLEQRSNCSRVGLVPQELGEQEMKVKVVLSELFTEDLGVGQDGHSFVNLEEGNVTRAFVRGVAALAHFHVTRPLGKG